MSFLGSAPKNNEKFQIRFVAQEEVIIPLLFHATWINGAIHLSTYVLLHPQIELFCTTYFYMLGMLMQ